MNEHIFEASKIYENILDASTLLLQRCLHSWRRRVHFSRVVETSYYISMLFLTHRAHFRDVENYIYDPSARIIKNSLKSLRSENHIPRFHLFNRSIRPYIL